MNAEDRTGIARVHARLDDMVAERAERGETLARIETRVAGLDFSTTEIKALCKEHNGDIKALKTWQARLTGAFGVVAFICLVVQDEIREGITRVFGG